MRSLSIHADMQIVIDDETTIYIEGDGGQVVKCYVPSPGVLFRIWRRHRSVFSPILNSTSQTLSATGVTLEFIVNDLPLAGIGSKAKPGLLSRLLNIPQAEIHTGNVLRMLLR